MPSTTAASAELSPSELLSSRPWLRYHPVDGLLLDNVPLKELANSVGTPTWVYSAATMRSRYRSLCKAMTETGLEAHIHYAVKANDRLAIIALFGQEGAGADVVSGGELLRARRAGLSANKIVYSGVGKSGYELDLALREGIGQINVESAEELEAISALASNKGLVARIALRVNVDVDAETNDKIATGRATDKFGIPYRDVKALYERANALPGIKPVGLAVHIGSQILSLDPYRAAFDKVADLVTDLRQSRFQVQSVDCGGGLGIRYQDENAPSPTEFASILKEKFSPLGLRIHLEPGRWLMGPAGILLASVIFVKHTPQGRFLILNAGMNDLLRPAMYDAWHGIIPVSSQRAESPTSPTTVVGPVCETSDTFARCREMPPMCANDQVAILEAGAYGSVMSSTYNSRPLAAEVLVDAEQWMMISDRQKIEDLWEREHLPA